jgi:hypothetical protein
MYERRGCLYLFTRRRAPLNSPGAHQDRIQYGGPSVSPCAIRKMYVEPNCKLQAKRKLHLPEKSTNQLRLNSHHEGPPAVWTCSGKMWLADRW